MAVTIDEVKREAKAAGIAWAQVQGAAAELLQREREARAHANEVREAAWCSYTSKGCWPFWRHGFLARLGHKVEGGDYTRIPGYDTLAASIASRYPEYAGDEGCAALWGFLLSPFERMKARSEIYAEALEWVKQEQGAPSYCGGRGW